jgi:hypothetical protein
MGEPIVGEKLESSADHILGWFDYRSSRVMADNHRVSERTKFVLLNMIIKTNVALKKICRQQNVTSVDDNDSINSKTQCVDSPDSLASIRMAMMNGLSCASKFT